VADDKRSLSNMSQVLLESVESSNEMAGTIQNAQGVAQQPAVVRVFITVTVSWMRWYLI